MLRPYLNYVENITLKKPFKIHIDKIFNFKLMNISNCEIKIYDNDKYGNISAHLINLFTYGWKPIIIQAKFVQFHLNYLIGHKY